MKLHVPARTLCLAFCMAFTSIGLCAAPHPQDDASRQEASLAEEQALQRRQLRRLRDTMSTLAGRLEAEGRVHAAELLRQGLEYLDSRSDEAQGRTLEELMNAAGEEIKSGRRNNALATQEQIIQNLSRLLDILMDRQSLDTIEQDLEKLREIRAALTQLADQERSLGENTNSLREESKNAAQKSLEQGILEALDKQRELLAKNESKARESGLFDLEELASQLDALLEEQRVSSEMFARWSPEESARLEEARRPLEEARAAATRAERLERAAEELRAAADEARQGAQRAAEAASDLSEAARREERAARASGDEAAEQASQALSASAGEMAQAKEAAERESAAQAAQARAADLERAAAQARADASAAREAARARMQQAAGDGAQRARQALDAAQAAERRAEQAGNGEEAAEARELAREATREALKALDRETGAQEELGRALEAAQASAAKRARELAQRAESQAAAKAPDPARSAAAALERAAAAMEEAEAAAAGGEQSAGEQASKQAQSALEEARSALEKVMQASADQSGEASARAELAEAQAELAQKMEELSQSASEGSMGAEAQDSVRESLQEAQEAMQRAAGDLAQSGSRSQAAKEQRKAIESLENASRQADQGVEPKTEEDRAKARELAQLQKEIEKRLLDLARLNEERESPLPQPNLEQAAKSASQAGESLDQGDLDQAQSQEEQTEQEIRDALDQLKEEEEQYQDLRQEELLFKMAEEIDAMLTVLREQMRATREADTAREGRTRPSRADRVRLRNISREFETLAQRAGVLRAAIEKEGVLVFTEVMRNTESDLTRIAREMGQGGGYRSDDRVQALQEDVETSLEWLAEALDNEIQRRQQERQPPPGGNKPPKPPLVPDTAELRLLAQLEREVLARIGQLRELHPELEDPQGELDPLLLEELTRLAYQHNRVTELFAAFRKKLGIPGPDGSDEGLGGGEADDPGASGEADGE